MSHQEVRSVRVRSGGGDYPVLVGRGLLLDAAEHVVTHAPAARFAVISDDNVAHLYGEALTRRLRDAGEDAELFDFPAGEASKTRKRWSILTDSLLEAGFGRDCAVLAVGGGVTGDLAGFVAATYLRGVPVVQIPTSTLAMIDASVGGKTGVDVHAGKNLVGAFHPPRAVIADPDTVETLPPEERAQGIVEAVKHGAIMDAAYLDGLTSRAERLMAGDPDALAWAVTRSVELKAAVVGEDEREAGRRQILNFGHTLGHALEAASGYALAHGTAVAAGMVLEAELGRRLGVTDPEVRPALERALEPLGLAGLPVLVAPADEVARFLGADKKARGGQARFVLLAEIGRVHDRGGWSHEADPELVSEVLSEALG